MTLAELLQVKWHQQSSNELEWCCCSSVRVSSNISRGKGKGGGQYLASFGSHCWRVQGKTNSSKAKGLATVDWLLPYWWRLLDTRRCRRSSCESEDAGGAPVSMLVVTCPSVHASSDITGACESKVCDEELEARASGGMMERNRVEGSNKWTNGTVCRYHWYTRLFEMPVQTIISNLGCMIVCLL